MLQGALNLSNVRPMSSSTWTSRSCSHEEIADLNEMLGDVSGLLAILAQTRENGGTSTRTRSAGQGPSLPSRLVAGDIR